MATGSHGQDEHRREVQEGPVGRIEGPFSAPELARIDEALTLGSEESGLYFSVYIGRLDVPTRGHAERLHAALGVVATRAVLVAVSPAQRTLEIVTGEEAALRLPDHACALAALSMTAAFGAGDLAGGITTGLRMLSDRSGHPVLR